MPPPKHDSAVSSDLSHHETVLHSSLNGFFVAVAAAVTKYLTRATEGREGLFWLIIKGTHHAGTRQLATLHLPSGSRERGE